MSEPNLEELALAGVNTTPEQEFFGKEPEEIQKEQQERVELVENREARWATNKIAHAKFYRKMASASLQAKSLSLSRISFVD